MTYRGRIKNGVVVFDEQVSLPEGAEVEVIPRKTLRESERVNEGPTLYEQLKDFVGIFSDLPPDFAENHDHYIHGCPKK